MKLICTYQGKNQSFSTYDYMTHLTDFDLICMIMIQTCCLAALIKIKLERAMFWMTDRYEYIWHGRLSLLNENPIIINVKWLVEFRKERNFLICTTQIRSIKILNRGFKHIDITLKNQKHADSTICKGNLKDKNKKDYYHIFPCFSQIFILKYLWISDVISWMC